MLLSGKRSATSSYQDFQMIPMSSPRTSSAKVALTRIILRSESVLQGVHTIFDSIPLRSNSKLLKTRQGRSDASEAFAQTKHSMHIPQAQQPHQAPTANAQVVAPSPWPTMQAQFSSFVMTDPDEAALNN